MAIVVFKQRKCGQYSYSTNPCARISKKTGKDIVDFMDVERKECTVVLNRKSVYDTYLCYINIINPFLYMRRFKVTFNPNIEAETVLKSWLIEFSADKNDAHLEFLINNNETSDEIECIQCVGASNICINTDGAPLKVKRRFAIVNISNTLLWMIATIVLLLLPCGGVGINVIVAALIDVGVSMCAIFNIIKQIKKRHIG